MNPLSYLRLGGGVLGLIALITTGLLVKDRFHQKALADDAKACAVAAAGPDSNTLERCLPEVRALLIAERSARLCDAALAAKPSPVSRGTILLSCGSGVKRVVAVAETAEAERDSLTRQLAEARANSAAAVTRAEARATRFEGKEARGREIVNGAPRTDRGAVRCDAECLRQLAQ